MIQAPLHLHAVNTLGAVTRIDTRFAVDAPRN